MEAFCPLFCPGMICAGVGYAVEDIVAVCHYGLGEL